MLPLLLLVAVPTSTGAGGYLLWSTGQEAVLRWHRRLSSPPTHSAAAYATGILTVVGTYRLHYPLFRYVDGPSDPVVKDGAGTPSSSSASSSRSATPARPAAPPPPTPKNPVARGYVPPQNLGELFRYAGPPTLARMGALSLAFFAAGALQTYVALQAGGGKR